MASERSTTAVATWIRSAWDTAQNRWVTSPFCSSDCRRDLTTGRRPAATGWGGIDEAHVGAVGTDAFGDVLLDRLKASGVALDLVRRVGELSQRRDRAQRIVDDFHHPVHRAARQLALHGLDLRDRQLYRVNVGSVRG